MRRLFVAFVILLSARFASAGVGPEVTQKMLDTVSPSLVAVKYTWESELGRRELVTQKGRKMILTHKFFGNDNVSLETPRAA